MKRRIPLITFLLLLILAAAFVTYSYLNTKTRLNDTYVNGNTAGNLYNTGLFCEKDGVIYFANPSDKNRLYSMDSNGTNLKKLSNDIATYINADNNYIYYIRNNQSSNNEFPFSRINTDSLCRINRNGKGDVLILDSKPCLYASLVGNYIYYVRYDKTDASSLYKVKIDGSDRKQVSKNPYFTCAADGQYIYYNGLSNNHNILQLDTTSDTERLIYAGNYWMPSIENSSILYFMDCDNNYRLSQTDLTTGETSLLGNDRIDCYNLYGDYIYFQRNTPDEPALCRIRKDGSDYMVIASGIYTSIHATDNYIYFVDFNSGMTYCAPTATPTQVQIFDPGTV